jgi:hypothetical protein
MTHSKPSRGNAPDDDSWLPELMRRMEAIYAAREAENPTPAPSSPPEPWVDKPGTLIAAENDVFRMEIVEKLQRGLCGGDVACCDKHRCRRRGRCSAQEEIAPELEAARARLAAEQAKWQPPSAPPGPPRARRKR